MLGATGMLVEWGWIIGYDCNGGYNYNPTAFMVRTLVGGGFNCLMTNVSLSPGTYPRLALEDENQNSYWNGRVNGTEYRQANTDFVHGEAITNGERDIDDDSAYSEFADIEELYAAGWDNFDNVQQFVDIDPDYVFCRINANRNHVERPPC